MSRSCRLLLPLASLALAAAPPLRARAADAACGLSGAPRIVAVGDVHGAYENFVAVLRMAGLLDARGRWSGGATHLVQTGDVLDRGPHSRKALDLLMRLEKEARKAGGRVHALLGNHEVMNMQGDLRYVSAEEYGAFRTSDSAEVREGYYQAVLPRPAGARGPPARRSTRRPFGSASWRKRRSASSSYAKPSDRRATTGAGCAGATPSS